MAFLHPWLLAGAAAASLPLIIHLIGRRRAPKVRFAAMDFLARINQRLARRERLRQLLLLLLRTVALLALAFAVARPMPPRAAAETGGVRKVALIVDVSASMAYELDGRTLLERAKAMAEDTLTNLAPGDAATLIAAGPKTQSSFAAPTVELGAVRDAVEELELELAEGVADMGAALEAALGQLGDAGTSGTVVVFSDLAANGFATVRPVAQDPVPELRLVDVANRDALAPLPNLVVEEVTVAPSRDSPLERTFEVTLRNHGAAPVDNRALELLLDGAVTHAGFVSVPGRSVAQKTFTHRFAAPGTYQGLVRLDTDASDGARADDALPFVVSVAPPVHVLAVNGDPRTRPYDDELFFVERALAAVPAGDPPVSLSLCTPDELALRLEDNDDIDAVILANVGALPPAHVEALRAFVQGGGGLVIALGDKVQFELANESLGALLPHPLRDVHLAEDPDARAPPLGIDTFDRAHPLLAGADAAFDQSLRTSRTARYFNVDVGVERRARPVLRFSNGAPALVEGAGVEEGRVLLWTTTLDVDFTDLPLRSGFPALLQRMVRYAARALDPPPAGLVRVGEGVSLMVPTGAGAVAVIGPNTREEITPSGRVLEVGPMEQPGHYSVEVRQNAWQPAPAFAFAVGPSLLESDYSPVEVSAVEQAYGGADAAASVSFWSQSVDGETPFAWRGYAAWALLALAMAFVLESLLAVRG